VTERHHPLAEQALALVESERFCEFLDATAALPIGWPHNRTSARGWLAREMRVATITRVGTDPAAASVLRATLARFELWQRNQELPL
jgi:hypothetical protein